MRCLELAWQLCAFPARSTLTVSMIDLIAIEYLTHSSCFDHGEVRLDALELVARKLAALILLPADEFVRVLVESRLHKHEIRFLALGVEIAPAWVDASFAENAASGRTTPHVEGGALSLSLASLRSRHGF